MQIQGSHWHPAECICFAAAAVAVVAVVVVRKTVMMLVVAMLAGTGCPFVALHRCWKRVKTNQNKSKQHVTVKEATHKHVHRGEETTKRKASSRQQAASTNDAHC